MTRRRYLSAAVKAGLAGMLATGALGGLFQLACRDIARVRRWMPREADRLEDAVQELRFALRDPDPMRSNRAIHRLRELTGSERGWQLAVGKAMALAEADGPRA